MDFSKRKEVFRSAFSKDGEYFAFVNDHGLLKIWETSSNTIIQENNLYSHAICTALEWGPSKNETTAHVESNNPHRKHQYFVIGTHDGEVLLYNFDERKLCYHFECCHDDPVNDLCWDPESNYIFSCSSDCSIVMWDMVSGKMKLKWKAAEGPLYSICSIGSNNLLSANKNTPNSIVSWWNIKDRTLIKKFNGLGSDIHFLLPVSSTDLSSNYFLSSAVGNSKISAWHLNKRKNKNVASFNLSDGLENLDVTRTFSKDKPMYLSAVTKRGSLLIYTHILNGNTKNNLVPQMTLHVVSKPTVEYSEPSPIRVIASKFSNDSETVVIAYGSYENPIFEKVKISDCPKTLTLARDKNVIHQNSADGIMSQMQLNTLGEYMSANGKLPILNSQFSSPKRRKQKDPDINITETDGRTVKKNTPITHNEVASSSSRKNKHRKIDKEIPSSPNSCAIAAINFSDPSSFLNSLLQCLQTEDRASLRVMLECSDSDSIKNAVASLPLNSLRFILIELHDTLSREDPRYTLSSRLWLKEILSSHLAYLTTHKDYVDILNLFKDYIQGKRVSDTLMKISRLTGLLKTYRIRHTSAESSDSGAKELMES